MHRSCFTVHLTTNQGLGLYLYNILLCPRNSLFYNIYNAVYGLDKVNIYSRDLMAFYGMAVRSVTLQLLLVWNIFIFVIERERKETQEL